MTGEAIDFVYFDGCPHADQARNNLRAALEAVGAHTAWNEWDLGSEATPDRYRRYGSPTVLIDGVDVTPGGAAATAMACRSGGAPSVSVIIKHLR